MGVIFVIVVFVIFFILRAQVYEVVVNSNPNQLEKMILPFTQPYQFKMEIDRIDVYGILMTYL